MENNELFDFVKLINGGKEPESELEVMEFSHTVAALCTRELAKMHGLDPLLAQLHVLDIPRFRAQLDKSEEDTIAYCLITTGHEMIYVCEYEPFFGEVYGYMVNMPDDEPTFGCWDLQWMMDNVGIWIDDDFTPQPLGSTIQFWEETA